MTEKLGRIAIETRGDMLVLTGVLDETAELPSLLHRARDQRIVLDLGGITFINSLGVRDWIRMQNAAQRTGVTVELHRVAEPIVHQLNMILAARGAARVVSFLAPYACDGCGREDAVLIETAAHLPSLRNQEPPAIACDECGAAMELNDFPERYFSFVSV